MKMFMYLQVYPIFSPHNLNLSLTHFTTGNTFIRQEIEANLPESSFAQALSDIQAQHSDIEIGSYPGRCGNQPTGKICISGMDEKRIVSVKKQIQQMLKDKQKP
ncbi:MAG: hypothetical protein Q9N62_01670 [Ghiorsea sp.]|nr:hypothetical protein [Ghiorsea sp.]